jgi:glc operon protein GlcG
MHTKAVLGLKDVALILSAARTEAEQHEWKVAIAVVDDGGHPIALERLDGCAPISAYIATEKARTAALGRRESKHFEEMINGGRSAFLSAPQLVSLEGGIPVLVNGEVVGAVGVSGVRSDQDAQIARAGTQRLALDL